MANLLGRSAATSKAGQLNVEVAEILKQGYWKNAKKLFNFYKKDIEYYAPEDVEFMRKMSHKKNLVKILGFEVSFNQLTDTVRRNVKSRECLPSEKFD